MTCGNIFENFATYFQCPNCHTYYEEEQAPSVEFITYTPSSTLIARKGTMKNAYNVTERVAQFLQKAGYVPRMYTMVEMKEELFYWDFVAEKEEKKPGMAIGVNALPLFDIIDDDFAKELMDKKERSDLCTALYITPAQLNKELVSKLKGKGIFMIDPRFETMMNEDVLKEYVNPLLKVAGKP
jgi:hypothetical protein